jgi:hypothetical protein
MARQRPPPTRRPRASSGPTRSLLHSKAERDRRKDAYRNEQPSQYDPVQSFLTILGRMEGDCVIC